MRTTHPRPSAPAPLRRAVLALSVCCVMVLGAPALAQRPVEPEPSNETKNPFPPSDLDLFEERCALTDNQREAAEALVRSFKEQFDEASAEISRIREEMGTLDWQQPDANEQWEAMQERSRQAGDRLRDRSVELQTSLLEDLKLLLSQDQLEHAWGAFERARLRRAYLPEIPFLGLRGDVELTMKRLVKEERLTDADLETARPIIDRWERAVDKPIEQIGGFMREARAKFEAMQTDPDPAEIDRWLEDLKKLLSRIKDAHERAGREVVAVLGPAKGAVFDDAFIRDRYPDLFEETDIAPMVTRLRRVITDLTPEQNGRIDAVVERFEREITPLRRDMMRAQDELIMNLSAMNMMTGPDESELEALGERADELASKAGEQIDGILTREQRDRALADDSDEARPARPLPVP